ncbi:MAG TPA: XdhC family protein [Spirochaetia bacterium]|nr:XdhC family protein [Spirochaetia bacterium]
MSYDIIRAIATSREDLALVTVIDARGSVPRHPGAKMLVRGGTVFMGTVGGGKGEAKAIALAKECVDRKRPATLTLEFQGTEMEGPEMVCGGTGRILIEYIGDREPYRIAFEKLRQGERTLFARMLSGISGSAVAVTLALLDEKGSATYGTLPSKVRGAAERSLDTGKPAFLEEEGFFFDPVFPEEKLLILGGGYVGQAVAALAAGLDFKITVGDDRKEFSAAGRFPPGVEAQCGSYTDIVEKFPFDSATYVVMVTRGHLTDLECVRAVLRKKYRYAGFIGSERKAKLLREQLRNDGFDQEKIDALHAPIGLDIKAETPAELAVSILAQLVAVRRNAEVQKYVSAQR